MVWVGLLVSLLLSLASGTHRTDPKGFWGSRLKTGAARARLSLASRGPWTRLHMMASRPVPVLGWRS